jgi:hypothetical protein
VPLSLSPQIECQSQQIRASKVSNAATFMLLNCCLQDKALIEFWLKLPFEISTEKRWGPIRTARDDAWVCARFPSGQS